MSMTKTRIVAAGLCLVATSVFAQLPQVNVPTQRMMPTKVSVEQLKENLNAVKLQSPSMKMEKVNISDKVMKPMTGIIPGTKQMMTRAGSIGAYYEIPTGIYNIKAGLEYFEGQFSRHGILAPIYQDIVYKNASVNATNFDWYINNTLVFEDSIWVTYVPGGETFYSPMPELTAYDHAGEIINVYQYGYAKDYETGQFTEGQAVNMGYGYVHNLDVGAESFYNTYMNTMNGYWTQMLFGYHEETKADYFEVFEKPFHPVFVNSIFTYVATPVGQSLANADFSAYVMAFDESNESWELLSEVVTVKPAGKLGSMEECDVWSLDFRFKKPLLIDKQFAIVLSGPQDGSVYWAFMYQDDRDLYSGKVTAGYIAREGDYAGYMTPYALMPDGATEAIAYPASLDLGVEMLMPYNMAFDPTTYDFVNYGGYTVIPAESFYAPILLWNWEAYFMGAGASMTINSDVDWLRAEITKKAEDNSIFYNINIIADPLPADVAGRRGVLTFTDGQGYQSTWTFVQGDEAAGIDGVTVSQDSNAPIYDLTGRLVSNPTKGIYIQNGKKIIVE